MPRDKVKITVRADPEQHAAWLAAAQADDRSLTKWIERCCDAAAAPGRAKRPHRKTKGDGSGPPSGTP